VVSVTSSLGLIGDGDSCSVDSHVPFMFIKATQDFKLSHVESVICDT